MALRQPVLLDPLGKAGPRAASSASEPPQARATGGRSACSRSSTSKTGTPKTVKEKKWKPS